MEVRQLQIFCTLAGELNFTRTAEKVNTVQSNVTAQIKALEEELGTPLFDRLGRRVTLTDAGQRFLPFATQALSAMEQGQRAIQVGAEPSGPPGSWHGPVGRCGAEGLLLHRHRG